MNDIIDDARGIGDNSGHRVAASELRKFCERIEALKEERAEIGEQIKEVRAHAKATGYDLKALDEALKLRAMDKDTRDEREALRTLYCDVLAIFQ